MIKLYNTPQGWMAKNDDPKVLELFGTDTLLTAFTERALPMEVLTEIKALNPDTEVIFKI